MKKSLLLCLLTAACAAPSGPTWVDYGEAPMENPEFMAVMGAMGTPGTQHATLAKFAGDWTVAGRAWIEPEGEPVLMSATAEIESMLGGRFTTETFNGDFMGMPYEGRLLQGYDNLREQYWTMWIDSFNTGYWLAHGQETEPGRFEFVGTGYDPMTPDGREMRIVTFESEDGTHTMQMFDTRPTGEEYMSMELVYTRS